MCIDYTDLNRAIPKKPFPLSQIDKVTDAVASHEVLCFLNVCKGYHQIPMAPDDMEKTTFSTEDGIFYYTRIPSRLKNAQADF